MLALLDRYAHRIALTIGAGLLLLWAGHAIASPPPGVVGECDPDGGAAWSRAQRDEVRESVLAECRSVASDDVCKYVELVGQRESSWRPGVRHTIGQGEHGLGLFGLSVRWHGWRVDSPANLCEPSTSLRILLAIVSRAVQVYGARDWLDVQNVFAGRGRCAPSPCAPLQRLARMLGLHWRCDLPRRCSSGAMPTSLAIDFCRRAQRHGFHCADRVMP